MVKQVDLSGKPFHFIGIGGIGMSALAYILAKRQLPVSGSDLRSSHITERLESVGACIFSRQEASNLNCFQAKSKVVEESLSPVALSAKASSISPSRVTSKKSLVEDKVVDSLPQVVCSTAIGANNAEYLAAKEMGCPILHRSDLLAALIKDYQSIAVAGTHGKTTTSSLIGHLLFVAGLDPTIIIGGEVDTWEGNAYLGQGEYLVAEADESDGTLVKHCPKIGIVTNIELDHTDKYQNLEQMVEVFQVFARQSEILIGCLDCKVVARELKSEITYSINPETGADYTVKNITYDDRGSSAEIWEKGKSIGTLDLPLLGKHNLSNALAAIATGRILGLEFDVIAGAISSFTGAKRRFEEKGRCNGITFIDDYAHHPSEIQATLASARYRIDKNKQERVVAIFQPHRYSRTQTFLAEFAQSFSDADLVVVTDIYSAGETNLGNLKGERVAEAIAAHHTNVLYHPSLNSLSNLLKETLQPGDLAIFLGAGNLNQTIPQLINLLK